jgi:lipoprotein-releasing system ATP-binding protein
LLVEMQREEKTMLLAVTHSLDLSQRFERRYQIDDGRLKDA